MSKEGATPYWDGFKAKRKALKGAKPVPMPGIVEELVAPTEDDKKEVTKEKITP